jgi:hypothetical protein
MVGGTFCSGIRFAKSYNRYLVNKTVAPGEVMLTYRFRHDSLLVYDFPFFSVYVKILVPTCE